MVAGGIVPAHVTRLLYAIFITRIFEIFAQCVVREEVEEGVWILKTKHLINPGKNLSTILHTKSTDI